MLRRKMFVFGSIVSVLVATFASDASACSFTFDTYYSIDTFNTDDPTQCEWRLAGTQCHVELVGIRYQAAGPNAPVLIWNHGSGQAVRPGDQGSACEIANYFVPLGYTVYVPVRRGHYIQQGKMIVARSTGTFWQNAPGRPVDNLWLQRNDVRLAMQHVDTFDGNLFTKIAIMGNSFGGMVSLFANTMDVLDHRAVVAFSPGGISWSNDSDPNADGNGDGVKDNENDKPNTYIRDFLRTQVTYGNKPTFFLQAKWDWDTRPTTVLSKVMAESAAEGADHGREFQASIFDFGYPLDPQGTHEDFPKQHALWGPTVLAFLTRYGVAP